MELLWLSHSPPLKHQISQREINSCATCRIIFGTLFKYLRDIAVTY